MLGLSSGGICLLYCAPVLFPFLMGEGQKTAKNFLYLGEFMAGRLAGYILFAVLAWLTGRIILTHAAFRELIFASAYILLSIWMAVYLLSSSHRACSFRFFGKIFLRIRSSREWAAAPVAGFLTGLNLCPPFLLAFSDAAFSKSIAGSIAYFIFFFAGTSLWFLPIPVIGLFRNKNIQTAGRMAALIVAFFYLYTGIIMFIGGVHLYE
jgi:sulfite exporter TauE/SafE